MAFEYDTLDQEIPADLAGLQKLFVDANKRNDDRFAQLTLKLSDVMSERIEGNRMLQQLLAHQEEKKAAKAEARAKEEAAAKAEQLAREKREAEQMFDDRMRAIIKESNAQMIAKMQGTVLR